MTVNEPRILHVIERRGKSVKTDRRLDEKVDHLSEYDAIVLEPTWSAMFGLASQAAGTSVKEKSAGLIDELRVELAKRATELPPFFQLGGLLVVRMDLPTELRYQYEDGWGAYQKNSLDTHAWFRPYIQDHRPLAAAGRIAFPGSVPELTQAGSGALEVREPGHPFEEYLRGCGRFRCRLGAYLRNIPGAVVLAENRAGDVVAVEIPIGEGSAVLVPAPKSPEDEERLETAVRRSLAQRVGARKDWIPPQERDLITARDDLLSRMRVERAATDARLTEVRAAKAKILREEVVSRAVSYYRQATAPGSTPDRTLGFLYKITDLLRDHFGGGDPGLAEALGMTVGQIKKIKKVANQPEKDLRHAGAGPTDVVTDTEIAEATAAGYAIVENLIARRLTEELAVKAEPSQA